MSPSSIYHLLVCLLRVLETKVTGQCDGRGNLFCTISIIQQACWQCMLGKVITVLSGLCLLWPVLGAPGAGNCTRIHISWCEVLCLQFSGHLLSELRKPEAFCEKHPESCKLCRPQSTSPTLPLPLRVDMKTCCMVCTGSLYRRCVKSCCRKQSCSYSLLSEMRP